MVAIWYKVPPPPPPIEINTNKYKERDLKYIG